VVKTEETEEKTKAEGSATAGEEMEEKTTAGNNECECNDA
jgi:hypothetical protein